MYPEEGPGLSSSSCRLDPTSVRFDTPIDPKVLSGKIWRVVRVRYLNVDSGSSFLLRKINPLIFRVITGGLLRTLKRS